MRMIKKLGILTGALLLTAGIGTSYAADDASATKSNLRVAIVNVQEVLQKSPRVTAISQKLQNEFKDRQTKINDQQKGLQDELDKFKKESATMSDKQKDTMQKKMTNEKADLVKQFVAYQQDLQKEQNKAMQGILKDLNGIVSNIAKDQNYSLVLDSQAVIFAADGTDITKSVADKFNGKKS